MYINQFINSNHRATKNLNKSRQGLKNANLILFSKDIQNNLRLKYAESYYVLLIFLVKIYPRITERAITIIVRPISVNIID